MTPTNFTYTPKKEDLRISFISGIILVLLTLAAGASTYLVMQHEAESILKKHLSAFLQYDVRGFRNEIHYTIRQSVTVATRPFVIHSLKGVDTRPGNIRARHDLQEIARSFLPMGFSAVEFVNRKGEIVAHAGSFQVPPFTVHIKASQETFLQWKRRPLVQTLMPVKEDKRYLGFVITQAPLLFMAHIRPMVRALGHTADLAVCAPLGATAMRCLPSTLHVHYANRPISQFLKGQPVPMHFALEGRSGVIYAQDYLDHAVVAAFVPIGNTGLGMVLKMRQSDLFHAANARLRQVAGLLLALLLTAMLLMRWLVVPLLRKRTEAQEATRAANTALRTSEARTQALLAHIADGVIVIDTQGVIETFNAAAEQIFGYEAHDVIGKNVSLLMPEPHRSQHDQYLKRYHETGRSTIIGATRELEGMRHNGEIFPLEIKIREVDTGAMHVFIAALRDITREKEAAQHTLELATHDALTGLPNRLLLSDRLDQALVQARRAGDRVALLFLDLDGFKTINDSLGHATGDLVLKAVAQRLTTSLRATDTVARQGGDEFVVVLTGLATLEAVDQVTQKLLTNLIAPYSVQDRILYVGASMGITVFPDDGVDRDTLLKNCDIAMYRAKEAGGNTRLFFAPTMNQEVVAKQSLSTDLHQALARDEFRLYYQPVVDLVSGAVVGLEALIRWQHPMQGLLSPSRFITLAEETGLIVPIGEWVLTSACAQWQAWAKAGIDAPPIAVNLSARQFRDSRLVATLTRLLKESDMPPDRLVLEITESMVMGNVDMVIETLRAMRATGLKIAIDDFGTGYSSLSYLKRLPVSILKIDQSFVRDIMTDASDAAVVTAIINLAHSLHLTVIAEGVETEAQRSFLRERGCDHYQGYYFSKPRPAPEVAALLKEAPRAP
ncbi:EAL domain-containing protein [Acidiferrobacter sp.]|uniref:putative bifunctional diguanylate cyclase/phosphodiesterase n=1 Tax=Acidiferrobacter sp. TaxID=1872107 RepID=UPI002618E8BC|nr:EAL domain-containing protein [Acidiferrobacter sp.]